MSHDDTDTNHPQPYSSTSPSPDAGSTNSNRGNDNGPFDPGNTPPLVFAFIAIGFIVFGLVIAVVYKKCRPLSNSRQPNYQRSSVPIRRPSVQKPKLWDVWISPDQRVPDDGPTNVNDWDTFVVSTAFFGRRTPIFVDRTTDKSRSPCQRHLHTLILPPPPFACPNNTSKATLHDPFPGKTSNTGCSSDNRRQIQASISQSWSLCPNHPNIKCPRQIGHMTSCTSV